MDPIRVLPYGPPAGKWPRSRPDTCQHLTTRQNPENSCLLRTGRPHMSRVFRTYVERPARQGLFSDGSWRRHGAVICPAFQRGLHRWPR